METMTETNGNKLATKWYSPRLGREVNFARWGHYGAPVLLYPTAGGDFEECERFLMMEALAPLIDEGRIKVYSCDSVAGEAWLSNETTPGYCSQIQNLFDAYVYHEVVPAIRQDCNSEDIEIITAGASIGAFNAVATICRHPDAFSHAIGMSGTFDLSKWLNGEWNNDFYSSSPIHFIPDLGECEQLEQLRTRMIILPTGEGKWEDPGESWHMAHILGSRGIPNRVDPWGNEYDHDWITWREMLPKYLSEVAGAESEA